MIPKPLFPNAYCSSSTSIRDMQEYDYIMPEESGLSGNYRETILPGVTIHHSRFRVLQPTHVPLKNENPLIEMHLSVTGAPEVAINGSKSLFSMGNRQHNIFSLAPNEGKFLYNHTGAQVDQLEIILSHDFFREIVHEESKVLCTLMKKMTNNRFEMAGKKHLPLTPEMQLMVADITSSVRSGFLKKMYLEARILELLMLQVEAYEKMMNVPPVQKQLCSQQDIEKLYYIRELISRDPTADYTLTGLSRKAGINTFKLKNGFKQEFGTTVFAYIHCLKMEMAKRMLLEEKRSVTEVAYWTGFNHPGNFATSFRKKFGITPGALKGES